MRFYIQLLKVYTGNAMTWWKVGGQGYTTNLLNAEQFEELSARQLVSQQPEKFERWPVDYIQKKTQLTVDHQYVKRGDIV